MEMENRDIIDSLKFESAMKELEEIIKELEKGEPALTLEKAVDLYKKGILLSDHCKQKLQNAQREINILTKSINGELEEIPFQEEPDEEL